VFIFFADQRVVVIILPDPDRAPVVSPAAGNFHPPPPPHDRTPDHLCPVLSCNLAMLHPRFWVGALLPYILFCPVVGEYSIQRSEYGYTC
jgi:hypothetical protein